MSERILQTIFTTLTRTASLVSTIQFLARHYIYKCFKNMDLGMHLYVIFLRLINSEISFSRGMYFWMISVAKIGLLLISDYFSRLMRKLSIRVCWQCLALAQTWYCHIREAEVNSDWNRTKFHLPWIHTLHLVRRWEYVLHVDCGCG